ncbi:hypothetical protein C9422_15895 [Pseudomonas sp. B1(2018)]|nr:hypothetical protein C9422_15895 [Pseudomonas sp. B1(2018)]
MDGSPNGQAERVRALGGPWKQEVKANWLESPFTLQKNAMIDMLCSFREITAPCVAKTMTSFRRAGPPITKTKVP